MRIEDSLLARRRDTTIEMRETASCQEPETLIGIGHVADVLRLHKELVGDIVVSSVTRIIHEHNARFHEIVKAVLRIRIALSCGIHLLGVSVQIDLIDHKSRILGAQDLSCLVGSINMQTVVSIVRQEADLSLPLAQSLVVHICAEFVHHLCGLLQGAQGQAAYADIHLGFLR